MWKKIAISGAVGAAILGSGAAALAASTSPLVSAPTGSTTTATPTGTGGGPSTASGTTPGTGSGGTSKAGKAGQAGRGGRLRLALRNFEHAEWVTHAQAGDVTHDAVEGLVTAVSPTSITVKATDGFSETFAINATTKVRIKGTNKSASGVAVNDRVVVAGVKSGSAVTANHIVDAGARK